MPDREIPALYPWQCCFVVDDVPSAVDACAQRFGWGPFQQFTAPVEDASYRDWSGRKVTDVALGMAGKVQIEFIHVHEGHDAVETYQAEYGTGFQHLGIRCRSREAALSHLDGLGASVNEMLEYADIRIAFVDVPTGDAMFELLQPVPKEGATKPRRDAAAPETTSDAITVDRATIATRDLDAALRFYAAAFGWEDAKPELRTLRCGSDEARVQRFVGRAGSMQLELLQPDLAGEDPYSAHLRRGDHGLVHAGGLATRVLSGEARLDCEWLEDGERFALHDWEGGHLALREPNSDAVNA